VSRVQRSGPEGLPSRGAGRLGQGGVGQEPTEGRPSPQREKRDRDRHDHRRAEHQAPRLTVVAVIEAAREQERPRVAERLGACPGHECQRDDERREGEARVAPELEDRERRGRDERHVKRCLEPGHGVVGGERTGGEEQRGDERRGARVPVEPAGQRPRRDDRAPMQQQADGLDAEQQVVHAKPERQHRDPEPGQVRETLDRGTARIERQPPAAHEIARVAEGDVGVVDDLGPIVEGVCHAEGHAGEETRDQPRPVRGGDGVGRPRAHDLLSSDCGAILREFARR